MLKAFFVPAIAVLNRMNFVVKFLVIGILLLLPFAYVTHLMRKQSGQQITFNQKESYGVAYITPGLRLLDRLQRCRVYSAALLAGDPSLADALEQEKQGADLLIPVVDRLDAQHRDAFRTEDGRDLCARRWAQIREGWTQLRGRTFRSGGESFRAYGELCGAVEDWILNYAANYSNLILDPDLDSYWLMDAFVARLPQISQQLSLAGAHGLDYLQDGDASPDWRIADQRLELYAITARTRDLITTLSDVNFKTAYQFNGARGGGLEPRLKRHVATAVEEIREVLHLVEERLARPPRPLSTADELVDEIREALDAVLRLGEEVGPELDRLILARVASYEKDKFLGSVAAETATFLHVYLFIAFYLAIQASVSKVAGFTRRMIQGTTERFELDGRDELGKVAEAFNEINRTLVQTRSLKEQVEESESRFRVLAANAPVGIVLADPSGRIVYANERWQLFAGGGDDAWLERVHPEDRPRVRTAWETALAAGAGFAAEFRFGNDAEGGWVAVQFVSLKGGLLGSATDLTERKRVEKLKNEFISTVSHELRTPLTSIRGSLGLLVGGVMGGLPPRVKGMLDIAQKNCERLVRLVSDILDIEKIESGKMRFDIQPTPLGAVLEQAVEATKGFAQGFGVTISLEEAPPGLRVLADVDRLTQVVTNLLSNAAKFSPKGEAVAVGVERRPDGAVRVRVSDRGAGIPEAFQARIFQKFAQAQSGDSSSRQGTGLGLSICKSIVERMGGRIGFETAAGKGTTFWFDLPGPEVPVSSAAKDPKRPTLLVCEDDQDIAAVLGRMLEAQGFNVDVATSAAEARERLRRGAYAGMTLDLSLPDQDGLTFVRDLREEAATRRLPIIVVSAYVEEGRSSLNGEAFGIVDWLEKPIDEARLRKALDRTMADVDGRKPRILHVEDDPDIAEVVQIALSEIADVVRSETLMDARARVGKERFDLLLLDVGLPDGSGLELVPLLRGTAHASTPVVVLSAQEVGPSTARHVVASLLKSKTSNEDLCATIRALVSAPAFARP